VQRRFGSFVDGRHHVVGGRLLDRMAGARDAAHLALPDFAMQPARFLKRQREVS
jgi:hypothetical protein